MDHCQFQRSSYLQRRSISLEKRCESVGFGLALPGPHNVSAWEPGSMTGSATMMAVVGTAASQPLARTFGT
jgi:hypothetical protein